jgi:hypothetical protein
VMALQYRFVLRFWRRTQGILDAINTVASTFDTAQKIRFLLATLFAPTLTWIALIAPKSEPTPAVPPSPRDQWHAQTVAVNMLQIARHVGQVKYEISIRTVEALLIESYVDQNCRYSVNATVQSVKVQAGINGETETRLITFVMTWQRSATCSTAQIQATNEILEFHGVITTQKANIVHVDLERF